MTTATNARSGRRELIAGGLSFPTSLTFDHAGIAYVAESGLPFGGAPPGGRVWRLEPGGSRTLLVDGLLPPVNGLVHHESFLYVSGGEIGYVARIRPGGGLEMLLEGLPGPGNYHTNMVVPGPDGRLYFSQGALTNTAIVGLDAYELGWLRRLPHSHDLPGHDVTLAGVIVETDDPLSDEPGARAGTGAFSPFGNSHPGAARLSARVPCTAAVMSCRPDGTGLEVVAWGLRNAYGLGFLPDGRLLATDQGADDRGSRPVGGAPDMLFEVRRGAWYGWPDFIGGDPVTDPRYAPTRGPAPGFVLANHDSLPPPERPLLRFPVNAAAVKFDVAPAGTGALAGQLIVALFGDERPMTAPAGPRVGRSVVSVDPHDWSMRPLAGGFSRPIDVRFSPVDGALHVVDFGDFEMKEGGGLASRAGSGGVWRLSS